MPPDTTVLKRGAPWWIVIVIGLIAVAAAVFAILAYNDARRLERHNRELVDWGRTVQVWSVKVSNAIWGPGGDPCCKPPNPPPELDE